MLDDDVEENLKLLEKKMHAKKTILKEVLRTIDTEKGRNESAKSRKYIKDMLNCQVSIPSTENTCFSIDVLDSFGFGMHVITRIRVHNKLTDNTIRMRISALACSTRWILFEEEQSVKTIQAVRPNSSAVLLVALPFSAFFHCDQVSIIVESLEIPSENPLFNAVFHSVAGENQTAVPLEKTIFSLPIEISKVPEEDVKSIEFCDEHKAMKIVQSLFAVFSSLPIPESVDVSLFRREFPRFSCIDFDKWRLFVGVERFDSIFVYISTEGEDTKNSVLARSSQYCKAFFQVLNQKCAKVD